MIFNNSFPIKDALATISKDSYSFPDSDIILAEKSLFDYPNYNDPFYFGNIKDQNDKVIDYFIMRTLQTDSIKQSGIIKCGKEIGLFYDFHLGKVGLFKSKLMKSKSPLSEFFWMFDSKKGTSYYEGYQEFRSLNQKPIKMNAVLESINGTQLLRKGLAELLMV